MCCPWLLTNPHSVLSPILVFLYDISLNSLYTSFHFVFWRAETPENVWSLTPCIITVQAQCFFTWGERCSLSWCQEVTFPSISVCNIGFISFSYWSIEACLSQLICNSFTPPTSYHDKRFCHLSFILLRSKIVDPHRCPSLYDFSTIMMPVLSVFYTLLFWVVVHVWK